jgi:EAL domain-containing protein (putative c-di-GMP-specific phosphodiesterase class I)
MSIGEWVLRQACRQWNDWHLSGQSIPIAINISMHQLQSLALPTLIRNVKAENGMPPGDLEIEITESAAMSDPDVTGKVLSTLRASGVRIAIDDFGTGYSSLAYLKQFSVDVLKIDRSFIRDIDTDPSDYKLVSAMVMMSHGLGLQVVAEGVETGEQLERLKACGCDFAQGYYFGHPVLPEAVFSNYASGSLS